jgi:hypothetical protein
MKYFPNLSDASLADEAMKPEESISCQFVADTAF